MVGGKFELTAPSFFPLVDKTVAFFLLLLLQFPRLANEIASDREQQLQGSGTWGHTCDTTCNGLVTPRVLMKRYNFDDTAPAEETLWPLQSFKDNIFLQQIIGNLPQPVIAT